MKMNMPGMDMNDTGEISGMEMSKVPGMRMELKPQSGPPATAVGVVSVGYGINFSAADPRNDRALGSGEGRQADAAKTNSAA